MFAALALLLAAAPDFQRDFIEAGDRAAAIADDQHLRADPDGSIHLDGAWSLRFSLDAITRGSTTCATTFEGREVDGPLLTQHRACGVTETWSTANHRLEHAFTIATRPPGSGPVRIRLSVDGPWHHRDAHGHLFAGPGGTSALRYGDAFIIRGSRRIPIAVEHHDRSLELIIPADQLDTFPMRIDPVLSTEIDLGLPTTDTVLPSGPLEPAVIATSFDPISGGRYLVAWRDDRFSADGDLFIAENVFGTFQPARPLTVRRGAQHHVALGFDAPRVFVAWEEPDGLGQTNVYSCTFAVTDDPFTACLVPRLVGRGSSPTFDVHGSATAGWLTAGTATIFDVYDGGVRFETPAFGATRLRFATRAGRTVLAVGFEDAGVPFTRFLEPIDAGVQTLSTPQIRDVALALAADAGLYAAGLDDANELATFVGTTFVYAIGISTTALAVFPTADVPDLAFLTDNGLTLNSHPAFVGGSERSLAHALTTLIGTRNGTEVLLVGSDLTTTGARLQAVNTLGVEFSSVPLPFRAPPSSPRGAMNEHTALTVHRLGDHLVWQRFSVSDAGTIAAPGVSNGTFDAPLEVADGFDVALVAGRAVVAHFTDPNTLVFDSLSATDVPNRTALTVIASDGRVRVASTGQTLYAMWRSGQVLQYIAIPASELVLASPQSGAMSAMEDASDFEVDCMPDGPCLGAWTLAATGRARLLNLDSTTAPLDVGSQSTGGRVMNVTHDLNDFWVALGTATQIEFYRRRSNGASIAGGPQFTLGTQFTVGATARLESLPGIPPLYFGQSRVEPGTVYAFRDGEAMPQALDFPADPSLTMLSGAMGSITARRVVNGAVLLERFTASPLGQRVLAVPFIEGFEDEDAGIDAGEPDAGIDAGEPDAGPVEEVDAGSPDAGPEVDLRPNQFKSCGCSEAPTLFLLVLLILLPSPRRGKGSG